MFTRTVELTTKSGKGRELANTINDKVLPILKKQTGFVDETLVVSDAEPNRVLAPRSGTNRRDFDPKTFLATIGEDLPLLCSNSQLLQGIRSK